MPPLSGFFLLFRRNSVPGMKSLRVKESVRVSTPGLWESVEARREKDGRRAKKLVLDKGGREASVLAPSGRFRDPRVTERRRRRLPRLTGGLGFLSREVPSELGGGGTSGSYTRIEHQFRRLSSLLL